MRYTQGTIERLTHGKDAGGVRCTQNALEIAYLNPPAEDVRATQGVIEILEHSPLRVIVTQMCIEVAWPRGAEIPPEEPPESPWERYGVNNAMLLVDLSEAGGTLPDYGPGRLPEYA